MHDLKFLRQNRDKVEAGITLKGMSVDLARFYAIEERRLQLLHESEQLKARRNAASEEIAAKKRRGRTAEGGAGGVPEVGARGKGLARGLRHHRGGGGDPPARRPHPPHAPRPPPP